MNLQYPTREQSFVMSGFVGLVSALFQHVLQILGDVVQW